MEYIYLFSRRVAFNWFNTNCSCIKGIVSDVLFKIQMKVNFCESWKMHTNKNRNQNVCDVNPGIKHRSLYYADLQINLDSLQYSAVVIPCYLKHWFTNWIVPYPGWAILSNIDGGGGVPLELREGSGIHVPSPTFKGLLIKQNRPLTLIVRVYVRIFKKFKKYVGKFIKYSHFYFWQISTWQWHMLSYPFFKAFSNIKVLAL